MKKFIHLFLIIAFLWACSEKEKDDNTIQPEPGSTDFISAVDISSFPEIEESNPVFYNRNGEPEDFLTILKNNEVNTIRLRLWVNPENNHSGFNEVKVFSERLKPLGFKIWLTLHYSDTWADPGHQQTPPVWQDLDFSILQDSVYNYTAMVVDEIDPDYIQIGNEINSGMLFPYGNIDSYLNQFKSLLSKGAQAVRDHSEKAKIIIHYAGMENSQWFFSQLADVDYDIIGLSYYPIWHGKDLELLTQTMINLSAENNKDILIAETAYPFTLGWNDYTNNIVGLEEHLILPGFPATPEGQQAFVDEIIDIVQQVDCGIGFCYWGAELVAWKGTEATDASPWENQALFDFDNKALPVIEEFGME